MVPPEEFHLTIAASPANLAAIADFIADAARAWELSAQETYDIQIAVDEACTNIIEHGYRGDERGQIDLTCRLRGARFVVIIRSGGGRWDPDAVPEPDVTASIEDRPVGGLGLYLMRRLMDAVRFEFGEGENQLTMEKQLAPIVVRRTMSSSSERARTILPRGRIDMALAPDLESALEKIWEDRPCCVIVNLALATYIGSAGLKALLGALRRAQAEGVPLALCCVRPPVHRSMYLAGFTSLFDIFDDEAAAAQALCLGEGAVEDGET